MSGIQQRIEQAMEKAQEAFWAEVVKVFPEAKSGDFDPVAAHDFDLYCRAAIKHWVDWNAPDETPTREESLDALHEHVSNMDDKDLSRLIGELTAKLITNQRKDK
jgi:hypothetical protein